MSAVSSGLQTPAFKAFINIAPEKQVAGFGSDLSHLPIASSGGFKGWVISIYNSIASAFSSTFARHKAEQGTAAHQAFISSLTSEYGGDIGSKVSRRCGLDTALSKGQQLSGQVIQDAFKTAESLQRVARFEQSVLQSTAISDSDGFQTLCRGQGVNPEDLSSTQRETFDDLIRGSGLINRDTGTVGDKAPNVLLLVAGQELAIRVATMPDSAFDRHISTAMDSVDKQLKTGEIDAGQAAATRNALVAAGRKMEFATSLHALGVCVFLDMVPDRFLEDMGYLTRDLLVLVKTQHTVLDAMTDIRTALGKTSSFGAEQLAEVNLNAFRKAMSDLPTDTSPLLEMKKVAMFARTDRSALCCVAVVLDKIINEKIRTSDQNGDPNGVPQQAAASAWSMANTLVGLAFKEAQLSSSDIRTSAFMKGEGITTLAPMYTATVVEHVNQFRS